MAETTPLDSIKGIAGKVAGGFGKLAGIDTGGGGFQFSGSSSASAESSAGEGSFFQFGNVNTGGRSSVPVTYILGGLAVLYLVTRRKKK